MDELSKSGNWIKRYDREVPGQITTGNVELIDRIGNHVAKHVGDFDVLHEIVSPHVHLDIFHVPPDGKRNFHTFVTCGASEKPMAAAPTGSELMELVMLLPREWPVSQTAFNDEANWWPLRQLKTLGRFPHEFDTWLGFGHTVGNGEPPQPFHGSTQLCGSLLFASLSLPRGLFEMPSNGTTTRFYGVFPLYAEEIYFKLDNGLDPLIDLFERYQISDVVDPIRVNVVTGKAVNGGPFTVSAKKPWWKIW